MKRGTKLLALMGALVLILAAAYGATLLEESSKLSDDTTVTLLELEPDTVTAIGWDYSEEVTFEKQDDCWVYAPDSSFPLDEIYLEDILDTLSLVTSSKIIENVDDWDQYTLEVPVCRVWFSADGVDYELKIGQENATGGQRYVSVGDGNAYLVSSGILDVFSYGLYDLLVEEAIPDVGDVTALSLSSPDRSYTLTRLENSGRAYSDDYVWFWDEQTLDTELTEDLIATVTELSWTECVDFHVQELADYGLDTPAASVTVTGSDNLSFTLEIGSETGSYRYARLAGSQMVYKIRSSVVETLLYTTGHELLPDEVLLMDWTEVTSVDVTVKDQIYTFTRQVRTVTDDEGNETQEAFYTCMGEEVNFDAVTDLLDSMTSAGYATGLSPENEADIRLLIHRDHALFPQVELTFSGYDSSKSLACLNGAATVFVSRDNVTSLISKVDALVSSLS